MSGCIYCARGNCFRCHLLEDECCIDEKDFKELGEVKRGVGRPPKEDHEIIDPRSTNRKRAQAVCREYGVEIGEPCEWRGLANVGLAKHPVVGCVDGFVAHIHHIDKNTFNNNRSNLAGICHTCHRRTHAHIDPCTLKDTAEGWAIAVPRAATKEELALWNREDRVIPKADHSNCVLVR